jgi:hypothetical protein
MTPDLPTDAPAHSRRTFFAGSAALAAGLVLAACGSGSDEQLPITGSAPAAPDSSTTTTPGSPAENVTWLKTAQSVELLAAEVCQRALDTGHVEGAAAASLRTFERHHREHASVLGDTLREIGASGTDEANQYLMENEFEPLFAEVSDQTTALQAVLLAENVATGTLVKAAPSLTEPGLRATAMSIAGVDARQITVLHGELDMVLVPTPFFRTADAAPKLALVE